METSLDLSRWHEVPRGVAYRRWCIIRTGLQVLLRMRFYRILLGVAWSAGLLVAGMGFLFSQAIASGGWLSSLARSGGPRLEAIITALTGFVALYPDICVRGIFTLMFWMHASIALFLCLLALAVMVPRLVTRDRASNALVIYLSRPLTTTDYLLGKLGMIVGMILLLWTGPLLLGWLGSMLFATDRDFFIYSVGPLGRALLFNGIALVSLACIALGVSAVSRTTRNTIAVWVGLWLVMGALAAPPGAPNWIRRASFSHDLNEARQEVFRMDTMFKDAASKLPFLNARFADSLNRAGEQTEANDFIGALAGLGVFVAVSSFVFLRRIRPE